MYRTIAIALVLASYATATPVPQQDPEAIVELIAGEVGYEDTTSTIDAATTSVTSSDSDYPTQKPQPPSNNTVYPVSPFGHCSDVSCQAGSLASVVNDAASQWSDADARNAYHDMWTAFEIDTKGLSLSNFIGDYFKARPSLACELLDHENCQNTINCGHGSSANAPVDSPAGYLIINSMVYLHNFHAAFYKGLQSALNPMQCDVGKFSGTVRPILWCE